MPPLTYQDAFALRDSPFGPRRPMPGVSPPLTQSLESRPLLIHQNRLLLDLYSPDAGPFGKRSEDFEVELATAEYRVANPLDPASRGVTSYVFLILGDRGTGKSTLASWMIDYITRCTGPNQPAWKLFEEYLSAVDGQAPEEQLARLTTVEAAFDGVTSNDYCCVFLDDVLGAVFPHCLAAFERLRKKAATFMMLTSSDGQLLTTSRDGTRHSVMFYEVGELSPDAAIAFVRKRIDHFRAVLPPALAAYPLFPFDENDLRTAVTTGGIAGASHQGPVTIRQLSLVLHKALRARLVELTQGAPGFNVAALSAAAGAQQLIKIAAVYRTLVS
jgi:hypothetical protein